MTKHVKHVGYKMHKTPQKLFYDKSTAVHRTIPNRRKKHTQ